MESGDGSYAPRLCPSRENALLDQRFFNGIGNYLRAEILYRLKIPPFEKARSVLETLQQRRPSLKLTLSQKIKAKLQNPDLLELCHLVPKEVVQLGEAKDGGDLCFSK
ncbi:PREDICTED: endonuclease 8-like 1 [Mandrillus leucophaeus]|uniref:endonuclease 8-like 1 n=1 Tax=Mandrillus leucophaeus TaxID=9568 RepID=UPI0005F362FF|nr:PREDICTED: endonuclease 8-like 1 [Mandrillus leucophaeus]